MIIEEVVTNIHDMNAEERQQRHVETVYVESGDLLKRMQRVTTDHNREVGIRLPKGSHLSVGDVLYMDESNMIVLDVMSEELLIIQPRSLHDMGEIAHQLGNRHLPAQFEGDEMFVQYDYLVEELLQQWGMPYTRETRQVKQPFQHIGHSHDE